MKTDWLCLFLGASLSLAPGAAWADNVPLSARPYEKISSLTYSQRAIIHQLYEEADRNERPLYAREDALLNRELMNQATDSEVKEIADLQRRIQQMNNDLETKIRAQLSPTQLAERQAVLDAVSHDKEGDWCGSVRHWRHVSPYPTAVDVGHLASLTAWQRHYIAQIYDHAEIQREDLRHQMADLNRRKSAMYAQEHAHEYEWMIRGLRADPDPYRQSNALNAQANQLYTQALSLPQATWTQVAALLSAEQLRQLGVKP